MGSHNNKVRRVFPRHLYDLVKGSALVCLSCKNLVMLEPLNLLQIASIYFLLHPLSLLGDQLIHPFWCGPIIANRFNDDMEN